jgi:hypothetical protein
MADLEQKRLLKRIAELSSLINSAAAPPPPVAKRPKKRSANKVYVRKEPPAAVAATAHVLPPVSPAVPPLHEQQRSLNKPKRRRFVNKVYLSGNRTVPAAPAPRFQARPAPVSRRRLRERIASKGSKKKKGLPKGNRVSVFVEDASYRKMKSNVLQRGDVMGNKTLRVPKKEKQKPVCSFFLRGECLKEDCEFSHVFVGKDAEICQDFQKDGRCDLEDKCPKQHVFIKKRKPLPPRNPKRAEETKPPEEDDSVSSSADEVALNKSFIKL